VFTEEPPPGRALPSKDKAETCNVSPRKAASAQPRTTATVDVDRERKKQGKALAKTLLDETPRRRKETQRDLVKAKGYAGKIERIRDEFEQPQPLSAAKRRDDG
jgi:primosomal protein N'